ncbi:MAG: putative leucine-rich repeat-containing protein [Streblomastix strix]|uniref:Putative leucine-rich repeat-containing protein n=1 Tax=Streblomastix strix TaxID=222440 RepID=A0A5J4WYQ9_9EUKA|nr:MAG: putative leucine-rich repeat-containing protein [Streblomastix strix]
MQEINQLILSEYLCRVQRVKFSGENCVLMQADEEFLVEEFDQQDFDQLLDVEENTQELTLEVDTRSQSVASLGKRFWNVRELKLSGSTIPALRDLGASFSLVRVLWLSRCGIRDLDGIGLFPSVTELYVSFNNISDLGPLSSLYKLEILDIDSNDLHSLDQLLYLTNLPLTALTLDSNPVIEEENYRLRVIKILPKLQTLDDKDITDDERQSSNNLIIPKAGKQLNVQSQHDKISNEASTNDVQREKFLIAKSIKISKERNAPILSSEINSNSPIAQNSPNRPATASVFGHLRNSWGSRSSQNRQDTKDQLRKSGSINELKQQLQQQQLINSKQQRVSSEELKGRGRNITKPKQNQNINSGSSLPSQFRRPVTASGITIRGISTTTNETNNQNSDTNVSSNSERNPQQQLGSKNINMNMNTNNQLSKPIPSQPQIGGPQTANIQSDRKNNSAGIIQQRSGSMNQLDNKETKQSNNNVSASTDEQNDIASTIITSDNYRQQLKSRNSSARQGAGSAGTVGQNSNNNNARPGSQVDLTSSSEGQGPLVGEAGRALYIRIHQIQSRKDKIKGENRLKNQQSQLNGDSKEQNKDVVNSNNQQKEQSGSFFNEWGISMNGKAFGKIDEQKKEKEKEQEKIKQQEKENEKQKQKEKFMIKEKELNIDEKIQMQKQKREAELTEWKNIKSNFENKLHRMESMSLKEKRIEIIEEVIQQKLTKGYEDDIIADAAEIARMQQYIQNEQINEQDQKQQEKGRNQQSNLDKENFEAEMQSMESLDIGQKLKKPQLNRKVVIVSNDKDKDKQISQISDKDKQEIKTQPLAHDWRGEMKINQQQDEIMNLSMPNIKDYKETISDFKIDFSTNNSQVSPSKQKTSNPLTTPKKDININNIHQQQQQQVSQSKQPDIKSSSLSSTSSITPKPNRQGSSSSSSSSSQSSLTSTTPKTQITPKVSSQQQSQQSNTPKASTGTGSQSSIKPQTHTYKTQPVITTQLLSPKQQRDPSLHSSQSLSSSQSNTIMSNISVSVSAKKTTPSAPHRQTTQQSSSSSQSQQQLSQSSSSSSLPQSLIDEALLAATTGIVRPLSPELKRGIRSKSPSNPVYSAGGGAVK